MTGTGNAELDRVLTAVRSGEATSLDDLARSSFRSRSHLSRILKAYLGFPLRDFVAALRVERGISHLVDGASVTGSQVEAGHESASSYHHAFVRHTGMSPSGYRTQLTSLAAHLRRHQDQQSPLEVLHRAFQPEDHPLPQPLKIQVSGSMPGSALFVALHPEAQVKSQPLLGVALLGVDSHEVTALPAGEYFAMVVEIPRIGDLRGYFRMERNRRAITAQPLSFPLSAPAVVDLELREIWPTDPPITVNLPKLFWEALAGRVEVRNSGQVDAS